MGLLSFSYLCLEQGFTIGLAISHNLDVAAILTVGVNISFALVLHFFPFFYLLSFVKTALSHIKSNGKTGHVCNSFFSYEVIYK